MRIVLDANIIVSGALWPGKPGRILELCMVGTVEAPCPGAGPHCRDRS